VMSVSLLGMVGLVNRGGVETTAAYGAISQLWTYIQMPALAIGGGVSAMAAQNIGANQWDRVGKIVRAGVIINIGLTGAMVLVIYAVERSVLGLFLSPASPSIPIAMHIHKLVSWSFILYGISVVLIATMRANGAVLSGLVIFIVAFFVVRLGSAFALMPHFGMDGVWWSFPLGSIAAVAMAYTWYASGHWKKAKLGRKGEP
jgi:Na+-driven multidrug efflux pump